MNIMAPLQTLEWVDRNTLTANDYNPNKVIKQNLELLTTSIFKNGWTMPIVAKPNGVIIDGFHRWTIAGPDWKYIPAGFKQTLFDACGGMVPRVVVSHASEADDMAGTVTHNRARGTHLLEPMKIIVKKLIDSGMSIKQVSAELGMKPEEIFRLTDISRDDFLELMIKSQSYSQAKLMTKY